MKKRNNFSLIELLIVIAIILILISMIQPALQKTIRQAKLTHCQTKMRNQGFTTHAFAMDHNGKYMDKNPGDQWSFGAMGVWQQEKHWGLLTLFIEGYIDSSEVFYCPIAEDEYDEHFQEEYFFPLNNPVGGGQYFHKLYNQNVSGFRVYWTTYLSYNTWIGFDDGVHNFEGQGISFASDQKDHPDSIMTSDLVLTVNDFDYFPWNNHDSGTDSQPDGGNFLMNDGSVKHYEFSDLDYRFNHYTGLKFHLFKNLEN